MAKPLKKHIQQSFTYRTHGGKRPGAGRPFKGERPSQPHTARDDIDPRHPLHVSTRVVVGLGSLRKKDIFQAIRGATLAVFERADFHIVDASIQYNHLHLMVEAANKDALAGGMQAFLISAAKRINRALSVRAGSRRRGPVFADRYHSRSLKTPREVRNAIAYVLNNFRRHREDQAPFALNWKVDPYSTGVYFTGWQELGDSPFNLRPPQRYAGLMTWRPSTWLLRVGWQLAGPVSLWQVPGPLH